MEKKPKKDIKADDIYCLLAERYVDTSAYACAREVADRTGYGAQRWMDFVVVNCWESKGLEIEAFEVKISKSDFRRELMDPSKHNVFFDEIDKYSIVAPDYVLDDVSIIPPKWGVIHVIRNAEGKLELKTVRKPLALNDERASERKISRPFMASLCRAINKQSHTKSLLYKEYDELKEKIRAELEGKMANGRIISPFDYEEFQRLRKICLDLDIPTYYNGVTDSYKKRLRLAMNITDDIRHLFRQVEDMNLAMRYLKRSLKDFLDASENKEEVPEFIKKIMLEKESDKKEDQNV